MRDEDLERMADEAAEEEASSFIRRRRTMLDFRYDEQQEKYWDTTTGILLGARSVNGAIPRDEWPTRPDGRNGQLRAFQPAIAINDVDTGLTVEGSTWWPGKGTFVHDTVVTDRGAMPKKGAVCYNSYVPPDHSNLRNNHNPDKWINHVKFLFPDPVEHEHFFDFAAHMLQKPYEKVNHGIVIAGAQGIGKDTAMLPLRKGVGEWNAAEIDPDAFNKDYNPFVKSVMLVINEVRPHDEMHKASDFYNLLKPYLAAPPEVLPMRLLYANVIYVRNVCHSFLTTNDPLRMFIPEEDRRLFVMTSPLPDPKTTPIFAPSYFDDMYAYLADGGSDAVVRWLLNRDILQFNSGSPPPMTAGKKHIIESSNAVRRTIVDDVFEGMVTNYFNGKRPKVLFTKDFVDFINAANWFDDKQAALKAVNGKAFHFKMAERGFNMERNPDAAEWKCGKFRSRAAFVDKAEPKEESLKLIREALENRPLTFEAAF